MQNNKNISKYQFGRVLFILPIPVFIILAISLQLFESGNSVTFDPPGLLPLLNLLFLFICPMFVGYIAAKGYLDSGSASLITMGSGVFSLALGSLIAGFLLPAKGPNAVITIHNISVCLAGVLHLTGATLVFFGFLPERDTRKRKYQLFLTYTTIFVLLTILTFGVLQNVAPIFFIQGQGPTLLRQVTLGIAILSFFASGLLFIVLHKNSRSAFLYWYAVALILISIGLGCVFIQKSFGSPIGWLGRIAQYLGGLYLLAAVFYGSKEVGVKITRFDKILERFFRNRFEVLLAERTAELEEEIKERKQAESVARDSERQLRMMIAKSPLPMVITDDKQDIEFYNDKFIKLYGYTLEDISTADKWWKTCYPDEDYRNQVQQSWIDAINKAQANNTDIEMQEWEWTIKDNSKRLCEFYMVPLRNSSLIIMNDITEKKRIEKEVSNLKEFYRQVLEMVEEGIWVTDSKDVMIFFNPGMEKIAGVKSEDALGLVVTHDFPKETIQHFSKFYSKAKETIQSQQYEAEVVTPTGRPSIQSGHLVPRIKNGKYDGMICTIQDITERKQTEEQIKASLKEKETLLHEIHHRVKNNMQVISSLLKLQASSIEDRQIKDILNESQSRVFAMSAVHETLHGSENLSEIDLKTYLSKVTSSIFQTYSVNPGKIKLNTSVEGISISINQASPLGLIINELISNSLKYAFSDQSKCEITVRTKKADNELELVVMDNGVGMPNEFDWRNSNTLGLKLVRTLVENQLDGSIDLDSNNGTKFAIKFTIET